MAYEQPKYEVVRTAPDFEVRRYAPYAVVETVVQGEFDAARNAAFRRLFKYIAGENRGGRKIDMTVPVVTQDAQPAKGEKVEMTVPVLTAPSGDGALVMRFMLPSRFSARTAPEPADALVRVRDVDEQWIAARTFSGRTSESNFRDNQAALLQAMRDAGLVPRGEPLFAVYDGPFTLWFLRRNEVLVPMAPAP